MWYVNLFKTGICFWDVVGGMDEALGGYILSSGFCGW